MKEKSFTNYMIALKHIMYGMRIISNMNQRLDYKSFKPFYDPGYSPFETILIDIDEQ